MIHLTWATVFSWTTGALVLNLLTLYVPEKQMLLEPRGPMEKSS